MDRIIHPVSGETGFFASEREKLIIDVALKQMLVNSIVTSAVGRGEGSE